MKLAQRIAMPDTCVPHPIRYNPIGSDLIWPDLIRRLPLCYRFTILQYNKFYNFFTGKGNCQKIRKDFKRFHIVTSPVYNIQRNLCIWNTNTRWISHVYLNWLFLPKLVSIGCSDIICIIVVWCILYYRHLWVRPLHGDLRNVAQKLVVFLVNSVSLLPSPMSICSLHTQITLNYLNCLN